jgi:hypothetical protein
MRKFANILRMLGKKEYIGMGKDKSMKRISYSVPEETSDAINAFAAHRNVSTSQATKLLVERGLNIEVLTEEGGEILYRHPSGETDVIYRPGIDSIDNIDNIQHLLGGSE